MDAEHSEKICVSLNRIAAATLATSIIDSIGRKPTLKEVQQAFNDCYMVVNPAMGTSEQTTFQERIDKVEW